MVDPRTLFECPPGRLQINIDREVTAREEDLDRLWYAKRFEPQIHYCRKSVSRQLHDLKYPEADRWDDCSLFLRLSEKLRLLGLSRFDRKGVLSIYPRSRPSSSSLPCGNPCCWACQERDFSRILSKCRERVFPIVFHHPPLFSPDHVVFHLGLTFPHPPELDSAFVLKMNHCAGRFFRSFFEFKRSRLPHFRTGRHYGENPNYDPNYGAVVRASFLGRRRVFAVNPHFDALVFCRSDHSDEEAKQPSWKAINDGVRRLWGDITEDVFGQRRRAHIEPCRTTVSLLLRDVVKAQQFLSPDAAVAVIKALRTGRTDTRGRQEWLVRFPQFRGVFSSRGVRHG